MSDKSFTIKTVYVLPGIRKTVERVYFAIDSRSGGYPYWSEYISSAETYDTMEEVPIIGHGDHPSGGLVSLEVLSVSTVARVVEATELISEAKARAMAEIEKIQAELASRIAALGGMK